MCFTSLPTTAGAVLDSLINIFYVVMVCFFFYLEDSWFFIFFFALNTLLAWQIACKLQWIELSPEVWQRYQKGSKWSIPVFIPVLIPNAHRIIQTIKLWLNTPPSLVAYTFSSLFVACTVSHVSKKQKTVSFTLFSDNMSVLKHTELSDREQESGFFSRSDVC